MMRRWIAVMVLVCVAAGAWAQWPFHPRKGRLYRSERVTVPPSATYHEATVSDLQAGRLVWATHELALGASGSEAVQPAGVYCTTNTLAVLVFDGAGTVTTGTYRVVYWR